MQRRHFLRSSAGVMAAQALRRLPASAMQHRRPNFIVVLCDELGYGDIEPTGGTRIPVLLH